MFILNQFLLIKFDLQHFHTCIKHILIILNYHCWPLFSLRNLSPHIHELYYALLSFTKANGMTMSLELSVGGWASPVNRHFWTMILPLTKSLSHRVQQRVVGKNPWALSQLIVDEPVLYRSLEVTVVALSLIL